MSSEHELPDVEICRTRRFNSTQYFLCLVREPIYCPHLNVIRGIRFCNHCFRERFCEEAKISSRIDALMEKKQLLQKDIQSRSLHMDIYVKYADRKNGWVAESALEDLIANGSIVAFQRAGEWVEVSTGPLRNYQTPSPTMGRNEGKGIASSVLICRTVDVSQRVIVRKRFLYRPKSNRKINRQVQIALGVIY